MRSASLLLAACLALVGCAPALREPPSLEELERKAGKGSPEQVDALLKLAEQHWSKRDVPAARRAASAWLRAALADPGRTEGWIGSTRAMVWLADHVHTAAERRQLAQSAVHTAQWCVRVRSGGPACSYWLAVAIGVQARERPSTGLDAVPRMIELLEASIATRPALERAGPHRVLALVYLRAPEWPMGPGDAELGLSHARSAVELYPDYAPNLLALGEALAANRDRTGSHQAYRRAGEMAREAARQGEPDAAAWLAEADRALRR